MQTVFNSLFRNHNLCVLNIFRSTIKMIKINNLTKKYKDKLVLDKVNLQIPSNKISFFVGKNGSGKTTLMDILA
ncbi:ATP-binding cassette domain-containing protein, partial [Oenococcus oeni]|uniref:ATP-binding cassette domain-containing protein n=1 Tax=Oenococcus oeni TaxID=1247 RepID=UPI0030CFDA19